MHPSLFTSLSTFPRELEQLYSAVPESHTHWAPASWEGVPSEMFTAVEQICHIRDIEIEGYHVRLRRLLEEDNPVLVSIDSYQVAKDRRYPDGSPAEIFAAFRRAREVTVSIIASLTGAKR